MEYFKRKRRAFTLMELIITIFIIVILATVSFFGGSTIINKARITNTKTDLNGYYSYIQDMFYGEKNINDKTTDQIKELLNDEYLTSNYQIDNAKDTWKNNYNFYFTAGEINSHKYAYIIISSNGINGHNESDGVIGTLTTDDYLSAMTSLSNSSVDTGDDLGIVILMRDKNVSFAYYGFSDENYYDESSKIAIIDGNNQVYMGNTSLVFSSNAKRDTFIEIKIDNETINNTNYTIADDSTIVTILDNYIRTLENGKHKIEIISEEGTAMANFSVKLAYEVTFDATDGTVEITNKSVNYNMPYGNLPIPTRSGYNFDGWFTSYDGGTKIENTTIVTTRLSHTLFAHWTAGSYIITFNANGGTVTTTGKPVTYNSEYGELPVPTYTGYVFDGWYTAATGDNKVEAATTVTITTAQTLYAHWTPGTGTAYVVNHYIKDLNADTYTLDSSENKTGVSDSELTLTGLAKSITGFTYKEGKVNDGVVTATTVAADGTRIINLYYTRNSYMVTLNKGTGVATVTGAGTYEYGASVALGATMTAGYDWSSWTGDKTSATQSLAFTMPASAITNTANAVVCKDIIAQGSLFNYSYEKQNSGGGLTMPYNSTYFNSFYSSGMSGSDICVFVFRNVVCDGYTGVLLEGDKLNSTGQYTLCPYIYVCEPGATLTWYPSYLTMSGAGTGSGSGNYHFKNTASIPSGKTLIDVFVVMNGGGDSGVDNSSQCCSLLKLTK